MPTPTFNYQIYHPVSRQKLGELEIREPTWVEGVNGGSTFTGKVTVPGNPLKIAEIKRLTDEWRNALYVTSGSRIPWSGPLIARKWDSDSNTLSITGIDWRTWLYRCIVGPKADGTGTNTFSYSNVDQFQLARNVIDRMFDNYVGAGFPYISYGGEMSGILRNFRISGMDFKSAGQYLDDLANMDRGFEWDIEPSFFTDGLPLLYLQLYSPQRGAPVAGLRFVKTPGGGNILNVDELDYDANEVARRVWAVGEGPNAESTPWAVDNDPELAQGTVLKTDQVTTYSGALTRANLASYARAERAYRDTTLRALSFETRLTDPDIFLYGKGDRARITLQDRWVDLDVFNCRVISREMKPDNGTVKITVNLADTVMPEVDTGGAV